MTIEIHPVPRPEWTPLPYEGCTADIDIDVICLEGEGFIRVRGETAPIHAGERVRWPAGAPHRLWTAEKEMITLMIEYVGQ